MCVCVLFLFTQLQCACCVQLCKRSRRRRSTQSFHVGLQGNDRDWFRTLVQKCSFCVFVLSHHKNSSAHINGESENRTHPASSVLSLLFVHLHTNFIQYRSLFTPPTVDSCTAHEWMNEMDPESEGRWFKHLPCGDLEPCPRFVPSRFTDRQTRNAY